MNELLNNIGQRYLVLYKNDEFDPMDIKIIRDENICSSSIYIGLLKENSFEMTFWMPYRIL